MKKFIIKEDQKKLEEIREELLAGRSVEVNNEYETFYGVGFDKWLKDGIKDIPNTIEVKSWNKWEGYPWTYVITPNKK